MAKLDPPAQPLLSVVVPAYNEEDVLLEFHRRLASVLETLAADSEIVYVNDGSRDGTLAMLTVLRNGNPNVAVVDLSRNFGKEIAMSAGMDAARGDAVVVIDGDLQDPPELIPELMRHWLEEGYDVVYAQRTSRAGETFLKRASASAFYRVLNRLSGQAVPVDTGDFRLLSRRAVDALGRLRERHRFMKGLFSWIGFRQIGVRYQRDRRYAGESKWNYWRLWNFSIEGFTSFTIAPLKLATYLGLTTAVAATLYGLFILVRTMLYGNPVAGYPSLLVIVLFLGGIQLLTLGVIGEYLGRIFNETKQRPLYLVQDFLPAASSDAAGASFPRPATQRRETASAPASP